MIGFGQVYIPDANFKAYLVGNTAINTNGDSKEAVINYSHFYNKNNIYIIKIILTRLSLIS